LLQRLGVLKDWNPARALLALLLLFVLAGDRLPTARATAQLDLPPLMLWAWDRDDDLRFLDTRDTGVAYLAATLTQRAFFIDAIAALRRRLADAPLSVTALASWCLNESWTGQIAADEVVPMFFRMGYDGRRARSRFANGGDFRAAPCRTSIGIATDELPPALPAGRRVYVFNPHRWNADTYRTVRTRIDR